MKFTNPKFWAVAALLLSTASSAMPPPVQAPLARLFYTPQERARLDVIRYSGAELLRNPAAASEQTAQTVTLNGIITKRGGGLRAWLNGKSLDSGEIDLPVRVGRQLTDDRQLPLQLPGGLTARPKVGQVVNLTTGELKEGYQQPTEPVVQPTKADDNHLTTTSEEPSESAAP